jgi:hypothetical protein
MPRAMTRDEAMAAAMALWELASELRARALVVAGARQNTVAFGCWEAFRESADEAEQRAAELEKAT